MTRQEGKAPVSVRRLGVADVETYREIRLRALADAPWAFGSTLARERAFTPMDWARRLTDDDAATFLAEAAQGTAVGLVGGKAWPEDPAVPELVAMWVAPQWRGAAVASRLIAAVVGWAGSQRHADRVVLWVAAGNDRAIAAYRKNGFSLTGHHQPLPSDPAVDEVQMVRLLA